MACILELAAYANEKVLCIDRDSIIPSERTPPNCTPSESSSPPTPEASA
jgi:hypothetical protein